MWSERTAHLQFDYQDIRPANIEMSPPTAGRRRHSMADCHSRFAHRLSYLLLLSLHGLYLFWVRLFIERTSDVFMVLLSSALSSRRLYCCNLQQAIWMNKRFVEQRFPSSYKRSSQSITFSSAADALSYIQTTEWSKKVSLTFFAITLSTVSQLDGLTLHPPVANFLYIIVYMCQKLWKLAGSRLSYCKNY